MGIWRVRALDRRQYDQRRQGCKAQHSWQTCNLFFLPDFSHGIAQQIDLLGQEFALQICKVDRKKYVAPAMFALRYFYDSLNVGLGSPSYRIDFIQISKNSLYLSHHSVKIIIHWKHTSGICTEGCQLQQNLTLYSARQQALLRKYTNTCIFKCRIKLCGK